MIYIYLNVFIALNLWCFEPYLSFLYVWLTHCIPIFSQIIFFFFVKWHHQYKWIFVYGFILWFLFAAFHSQGNYFASFAQKKLLIWHLIVAQHISFKGYDGTMFVLRFTDYWKWMCTNIQLPLVVIWLLIHGH